MSEYFHFYCLCFLDEHKGKVITSSDKKYWHCAIAYVYVRVLYRNIISSMIMERLTNCAW